MSNVTVHRPRHSSGTSRAWHYIIVTASVVMLVITMMTAAPGANAHTPGWKFNGEFRNQFTFGTIEYDKRPGRQWFCALQNGKLSPVYKFITPANYPLKTINKNVSRLDNMIVMTADKKRHYPKSSPKLVTSVAYSLWVLRDAYRENRALNAAGQSIFELLAGFNGTSFNYSQLHAKERKLAHQVAQEATRFRGPYSLPISITTAADKQSFTITNVGVKTTGGYWFDGGFNNPPPKITLRIDGPAVFTKTNSKTMTVSGQATAQSIAATSTGNGTVTVSASAKNLPPTKLTLWRSVGDATSGEKLQDLMSVGEPTTASSSATTQVLLNFQPTITTAVSTTRLSPGAALTDTLRVRAAKGDEWIRVSGKPVPLTAHATLYGPYDQPEKPRALTKADDAKRVTTTTVTIDRGPGDYTVRFDPKHTAKPGFYTIYTEIDKSKQGDNATYLKGSYRSALWEQSETTLQPWRPRITSRLITADPSDPFDKILSDIVTVEQMPPKHGSFHGFGPWSKDVPTLTQSLYCLDPSSRDPQASRKLKPLAQVTLPATNGQHRMSSDAKGKPLSMRDFPCTGKYVFISDFAGDSRTAAVRTSDLDPNETFTPKPPTVTTEAKTDNVIDGKATLYDTINVTSTYAMASKYSVTSRLYRWDTGSKPTCDKPVFTSKKIMVTGPGSYNTDKVTITNPAGGTYGWVETLVDERSGRTISTGVCGAPSETADIKPVNITTRAAVNEQGRSQPRPDDDSNDVSTTTTGQTIYDTVALSAPVGKGYRIVVDLFRNEAGADLTCDNPAWTAPAIDTDGKTEYTTDGFVTPKAGVYHFRERLEDSNGTILIQGACGVSAETVIVENPQVSTQASLATPRLALTSRQPTITPGDTIHDKVIAHDPIPENATVTVELFHNDEGDRPTCDQPIWTSQPMTINKYQIKI